MRILDWMRIAIFASLSCCLSEGAGVPHFKVDDAVKAADSIVIADVNQVRDLGAAEPVRLRNQLLQAESYSADLSVRRTIKGPPLGNVSVKYSLPVTFMGYRGMSPGTRMVFLRQDKNQYYLADPYYSDFPATVEPFGENELSESSSQLVLSNMLAVLASATTSSSEKYEILRVDYALPSKDETVAALKKGLAVSTDRELTEKLQGELIRFGDLSQLPAATDLLLKGSASDSGRDWLLYAIRSRVKDARAVPALERLLNSPVDGVREAAVEALWHVGAPVAVPALVRELEDPDEKAQFYAVRGLSDIASEDGWGGPSEPEFHEHAQKYLIHWQDWAKNRVH